MATIQLSLSSKTNKGSGLSEVLVRFYQGRINQRAKTNVFVSPKYWNQDKQCNVIPQVRLMNEENKRLLADLADQNKRLENIKELILQSFIKHGAGKTELEKTWLTDLMREFNFPEERTAIQLDYFNRFEEYIAVHKISEHRKAMCRVVMRAFKRFAIYEGLDITFDSVTPEILGDFSDFLSKEHELISRDENGNVEFANKRYNKAFDSAPESRIPQPRGENAIIDIIKRLRAFTNWAISRGYTTNNPFDGFEIGTCKYGEPYYISNEERNQLYNTDLSKKPHLAIQRDIFVFQCLVGCRVSDLSKLTKDSVKGDMIEYYPRKTMGENNEVVSVPLNKTALEIIDRYKDCKGNKLLPFISDQKYNKAIKEIFTIAGLTYKVLVLNPITREQEYQPLNEIASSHMARRTFCGNLYRVVKDPNLIGKLSGHVEGSKAFARYRSIDDDMKREVVKIFDE